MRTLAPAAGPPGPEDADQAPPQSPARADVGRRVLRELGFALITAGAVLLLFVAYELIGTNFTEEHNQATLAQQFGRALSASSAPHLVPSAANLAKHPAQRASSATRHPKAGASRPAVVKSQSVAVPVPPPGGALDHLVIPAIGVDRYVVEGVGEAQLQEGPGHYPGTALPGQRGNVAIAGHRTTFGAPFFSLNELKPGELIYLTDTSGATWVYVLVHLWVVPPTDVAVLDPSRQAELTLTTCNPRFEATSRLVARAFLAAHLKRGARIGLRALPSSLAAAKGPLFSPANPAGRSARARLPAARKVAARVPHRAVSAPAAAPLTSPQARVPVTTGTASPTVGPAAAAPHAGAPNGPASGRTWAQLALWGALALGLWVAARLAARRRREPLKALTLVGGFLFCLLPLWFLFENAVVLMPANF